MTFRFAYSSFINFQFKMYEKMQVQAAEQYTAPGMYVSTVYENDCFAAAYSFFAGIRKGA